MEEEEVRMTRSRARRKRQSNGGSMDLNSSGDMSNGSLPSASGDVMNGSLPSPPSSLPSSPSEEDQLSRLSSSHSKESVKSVKAAEKLSLVLWRQPLTVVHYSVMEAVLTLGEWARLLATHTTALALVGAILACYTMLHLIPGGHTESLVHTEKYLVWCLWWVSLGILSSVGLGTGLHTFLLYLGPHIAAVTMAAYECGTTDFPQPPYPNDIKCPEASTDPSAAVALAGVTIWTIISKVRVEAFCWGMGTAIGELPPYFMARAARLSGSEPDEDTEEFLELQEKLKNPEKMTRFERAKYAVQQLVERVGFFGILAAASIPNPLFDLAGITCGHFLVPFWTFFGATLIGKAIVKMHIQKIFVILAFNKELFEGAVSLLVQIPLLGVHLVGPVRSLLEKQKEKLHSRGAAEQGGSVVSTVFEIFVLSMVAYFVVSIVNSLANSYQKRLGKEKRID